MPKRALVAVAIVCAASRFLAKARSIWDWDEALFCLGMRSYDVAVHHPHPPGFPAYIALGKIARMFASDDFHALQAVNLAAAMLLFPALWLLFSEAGSSDEMSIVAAALCVFFPNVWLFGGTAFSDIPSMTLATFAVALLFRGARDRNAYWAGALLLAVSIAIRPQNVLIGAFAGIYASVRRHGQEVLVALFIGLAVTCIAYGAALHATGAAEYIGAVRTHGAYIARNDSWRNPLRPPLTTMLDRFFFRQYSAPALNVAMSLFVLIGIAAAVRRRSASVARIALTFTPFAVVAWLMADYFSAARYAIAYAPLFALLAVEGMSLVARRWTPVFGGVAIAAFIMWCWPALTTVRTTIAPPVLGVEAAIRLDPHPMYVATAMAPFVDELAPQLQYVRVLDEHAQPTAGWLLAEIDRTTPRGYVFRRNSERLWNIVRHRYFTVALEPSR